MIIDKKPVELREELREVIANEVTNPKLNFSDGNNHVFEFFFLGQFSHIALC